MFGTKEIFFLENKKMSGFFIFKCLVSTKYYSKSIYIKLRWGMGMGIPGGGGGHGCVLGDGNE